MDTPELDQRVAAANESALRADLAAKDCELGVMRAIVESQKVRTTQSDAVQERLRTRLLHLHFHWLRVTCLAFVLWAGFDVAQHIWALTSLSRLLFIVLLLGLIGWGTSRSHKTARADPRVPIRGFLTIPD